MLVVAALAAGQRGALEPRDEEGRLISHSRITHQVVCLVYLCLFITPVTSRNNNTLTNVTKPHFQFILNDKLELNYEKDLFYYIICTTSLLGSSKSIFMFTRVSRVSKSSRLKWF